MQLKDQLKASKRKELLLYVYISSLHPTSGGVMKVYYIP